MGKALLWPGAVFGSVAAMSAGTVATNQLTVSVGAMGDCSNMTQGATGSPEGTTTGSTEVMADIRQTYYVYVMFSCIPTD